MESTAVVKRYLKVFNFDNVFINKNSLTVILIYSNVLYSLKDICQLGSWCFHRGIPDWSLNEKGDTPEKSRSREIPWYFWIFGSKSLQQ